MAEKKVSKPRGRPKVEIDLVELEKLCRLNCTLDEIAAYMGCSRDTIERRIREDDSIRSLIDKGRATGKISLRRKQFQILEETSNATMAIWLGKNLLGQRDALDVTTEDKNQTQLSEAMGIIADLARRQKQESGE